MFNLHSSSHMTHKISSLSSLALLLSKVSDSKYYSLRHVGCFPLFPDDSNTKKEHINCMLMVYSWKNKDVLDISG